MEARQSGKGASPDFNQVKIRGALIAANQGAKICFLSPTEYRSSEAFDEAVSLANSAEEIRENSEVRKGKIEFPGSGGRIFFTVVPSGNAGLNPFIGAIYDAVEELY